MVTRSTSYTLRASTPQPLKGECTTIDTPAPSTIGYVLQTFKAARQLTDSCEDQEELLCSNDMVGLGGTYVSASYTAQKFVDPDTDSIIFTEQKVYEEEIIEESEVPGADSL